MLENEPTGVAPGDVTQHQAAAEPAAASTEQAEEPQESAAAPAKRAPAKRTRKTAAARGEPRAEAAPAESEAAPPRARRTRRAKKAAVEIAEEASTREGEETPVEPDAAPASPGAQTELEVETPAAETEPPAVPVLFRAPELPATPKRARRRAAADQGAPAEIAEPATGADAEPAGPIEPEAAAEGQAEEPGEETAEARHRRRRRGGRGRRNRGRGEGGDESAEEESGAAGEPADREAAQAEQPATAADTGEDQAAEGEPGGEPDTEATRRRRRRRRRAGEEVPPSPDDPQQTVVKVRERRTREPEDEVASVKGSTRLEAKKQRRREGREAGRRRPPVITEAEFLARREAVERVLAVRQVSDRTQIAVLEDGVLVEHYVSQASSSSNVGNVYLGKVQNVLPSMEAAFVDIGKGRNAVLYAGEVNFDAAGLEGQPKRIEHALKSGQSVLVQVTKDPVGHKGARLSSQISLPGRYLVYVPEGSMTGISRKLPDTERARLKNVLKKIVREDAGVIVRTAAEGASEEELTRDVSRLSAQWDDIEKKSRTANAPALLYGEPDLTVRVIRDIFNEDFASLVVSGGEAWETVEPYVGHVAPDLVDRISRWTKEEDVFAAYRVDEQLAKALDRKVWLPSGGSLVIDRTEAMTVVDVNTGKFTGQGGNLEQTVTKNNLEAAEEIIRQLRLRDIGGIIVIDFIDMVLESNRDLVLRRMLECLGRDRTKHQVAEVTSLGLVQMTRKRVGQGLLEVFSETCECCNGRGVLVRMDHPEPPPEAEERPERSRRRRGRGGGGQDSAGQNGGEVATPQESQAAPAAPAPADTAPVEPAPVEAAPVESAPVEAPASEVAAEQEPKPARARHRRVVAPVQTVGVSSDGAATRPANRDEGA